MLLSARQPSVAGAFRRALVALLTCALLLLAASARADVKACVEAHGEGQERRDDSDFVAAAELFQRCQDARCPKPIRKECGEFAAKLDAALPTVVLGATDANGTDLPAASVELDGKPFAESLTGRSVPVNPGKRSFVFRAPDGRRAELEVLVLEGEKDRKVVARFESQRAPAAAPEPEKAPAAAKNRTLAYVLLGGGALALASFTYFALSGSAQEKDLRDSCAPSCSDADAGAVGTKYLIADISLVAAAGLLGTGAYFYFTAPEEPATGKRGFVAGVTGRF